METENRFNRASADLTGKVLAQMDEVKDVMTSNIDKILQRGERLELVIDKILRSGRDSHGTDALSLITSSSGTTRYT